MAKKYDYVIVGQGVAGSAMAWKLFFKKKSFIILDSEIKNSASSAALGIYNPITGRRKALTWNVIKLFKSLEDFYKRVEDYIGIKILFKKKFTGHLKTIVTSMTGVLDYPIRSFIVSSKS